VVGFSLHGTVALNRVNSGVKVEVMILLTGSAWSVCLLASQEGIISMELVSSCSDYQDYC
jgi:hypothetical protein